MRGNTALGVRAVGCARARVPQIRGGSIFSRNRISVALSHCEVEGFKVTLPADSSPEIFDACKRELEHIRDCGYEANVTTESCAVFAAVERPEVASAYDCSAKIPCDELSDPSAYQQCAPPPSTFGNELCGKLEAKCAGFCTADDRDALNAAGGFLKPEVMSAVDYCVGQSTCELAAECVAAWSAAVGL